MRTIRRNKLLLVNRTCLSIVVITFFFLSHLCNAQSKVTYSGKTLSNIDYHHGQLSPVIGVHNIQVMRANRENPSLADGFGWTYNHAPNVVYWNNKFYVQYLSDSIGEHIPPGQTLLLNSKDGYHWSKPEVVFPPYSIPEGTRKEGVAGKAHNLFAVMHQRMGFYVANDGRLLCLAYYGISMHKKDSPNDGKGIGRVVREIYSDNTFGPIYFIRYNKAWNSGNTDYPFYSTSSDSGFVDACDKLLQDPLMMQQWNEEQDRDDPIIPLKGEYKAFCYYHLPDNRTVGLWKHALFSISEDNGMTWTKPEQALGFVTKNAKIWGQRTSDGKYVTIYNPSEFRWPLALSVSDNGIEYTNLLLVNGEITTMRYGGNYKSYGPQYVRGIVEKNGAPPDGNLWITYSMNKEDIWISKIPVPIKEKEESDINDIFNDMPNGHELEKWNIYSPLWAPVKIESFNNRKYLTLIDRDPFDYARAERLFKESTQPVVEFTIVPAQNSKGLLHIEFQDKKGTPAVRLVFDSDSTLKTKAGYRMSRITKYESGKEYQIRVEMNVKTRQYTIYLNGKKKEGVFFAPVHSIERIVFRTGEVRRFPNADTPTDQNFDVQNDVNPLEEARFYIKSLKAFDE